MSENNNQRKTWIMYKKSYKIEDFDVTTIIPYFPDIWATEASNKYGTWKAHYEGYLDTDCLGRVFNGGFDDGGIRIGKNHATTIAKLYLDLPKGVSICPSRMEIRFQDAKNKNLYGFNIETQQWEFIAAITGQPSYLTTTNFYSSFYLSWQTSGASYAGYLHEWQIEQGKIRYTTLYS